MNLFQLIHTIKNTAGKANLVSSVKDGDVYENLNSGTQTYPVVNVTIDNITKDETGTSNVTMNIFYIDRLEDNCRNKTQVQSSAVTVLEQIMNKLEDEQAFDFTSKTFYPFTEKFADLCAGSYVTCTLELQLDTLCDNDSFEPKTLNIQSNGLYDVAGYDEANVNVNASGAIDYYWIMPHNYGMPSQITYSDIKTTLEIKFRLKSTANQSIYDDGYTSLIYEDNQYKARLNGGEWKDTFIREPDIPETKTVKLTGKRLQIGYYLFDLEDGGHKWSYGQHLYIGNGENVGDIDIYYCKLYWDKGDFADYEPFIEKGETVLKDAVSGNVLIIKTIYYGVIAPFQISFKNLPLTELNSQLIDTSNITSMEGMFLWCKKIKELDLYNWNVSNVTNMFQLFGGCPSLKKLNVGNWNTSKVVNMGNMFSTCGFSELDISNWDTSNVTNMWAMFYDCNHLISLDFSKWDASKVTDMRQMFDKCKSLQTLIGTHTLEEVEAGDVVSLKNAGSACNDLQWYGATVLRYSSILALAKGMYDRTSTTTGTLRLATAAFNACKNDDDTLPDAATLAERQAKIRSICAEKNYNLTLG